MYSSSFRPQVPGRERPACGSTETRLKCFSCVTHRTKRSQQIRKIARNTQLQGATAPFLLKRNPEPWHCVHRCMARASVSDRVHSITYSMSSSHKLSILFVN